MNKDRQKSANFTQKSAKILSEIGMYNQAVKNNLATFELSPIQIHTIKNFNDNAQRKGLTTSQYNKEVEEFNNRNGFILLKKGVEIEVKSTNYPYINYPYLDNSAIYAAIIKYRAYRDKYNLQVQEENKEINNYNKQVVKHSDKAVLKAIAKFQKDNNSKLTREYNSLVEGYNTSLKGYYVAKKRKQYIKDFTEEIFYVLLYFYAGQLKKRNAFLLEMNRPTSVYKNAMPSLKLNPYDIVKHKISGVKKFTICKKTAQNHVKRLREAGLLLNRRFFGSNRPVEYNFNPEIVEIFDGNPPKSRAPEKPEFFGENEKKLHNKKHTTCSIFLKENKIKDCANSTVDNKCGSMLEENESTFILQEHRGISSEKNLSRGEVQKIMPSWWKQPKNTNNRLTTNFIGKLEDSKVLAEKLAAGEYDSYKGLPYSYLVKVSQYAYLPNDEFKQVVIQDFIKSSAKIWKGRNVYVGEWKKAINMLEEQLFNNITQNETIIKKLREYRWKLDFARRWFKKAEVNPLYPASYFDNTRTKQKEIGFYGLHSHWKSHLKYQAQKEKDAKEKVQKANQRKRRLTAQDKFKKAIRKYELGKLSANQLYNYVDNNLPNDFAVQLPSILKFQTNLA
ncbi:conserved protein of unknown function [Tenacibaculum sp. 190524A02b]|uniref:hypothetical protein n=1 Tax=Tenacibaculum vairaonense TaxID=3137860 RepID=UPI0032B295E9